MMGYVGDGKMPPDQAFRGCLMISLSISILLVGAGCFVWLLSRAGCV
jgi:hypothetical protein